MDRVSTLVVGAGISGLATAAFSPDRDVLVLEADAEIGGYCKTVKKEGFVWDYSGHFFHFKNPEIEAWLRDRMPGQRILSVEKKSFIAYKGEWIDFPFQKNIHQLPKEELVDCLYDLFFARAPKELLGKDWKEPPPEETFEDMLYARLGKSIAEKFLIPYNEKLYATKLSKLDKDAMGRFFPKADLVDIVRNMKHPDNATYNATFTYPEGGAIEYVKALATGVPEERIALRERVVEIDVARKVAKTNKRDIAYGRLVSSMPFHQLAKVTGMAHDASAFSWNKVLVFNLGFDRKGPKHVHWVYYPDRARAFYRIGFYDNIFDTDRMSLYVELGYPAGAEVDVDAARAQVLDGLRQEELITDHRLVAEHHVVMDPAYVHITKGSLAEVARLKKELAAKDVHSIGRYGSWTYCSIEDNVIEAKALVAGW
jgi:protoporphyrinogen oxidase